jgi:hypothetical protein
MTRNGVPHARARAAKNADHTTTPKRVPHARAWGSQSEVVPPQPPNARGGQPFCHYAGPRSPHAAKGVLALSHNRRFGARAHVALGLGYERTDDAAALIGLWVPLNAEHKATFGHLDRLGQAVG